MEATSSLHYFAYCRPTRSCARRFPIAIITLALGVPGLAAFTAGCGPSAVAPQFVNVTPNRWGSTFSFTTGAQKGKPGVGGFSANPGGTVQTPKLLLGSTFATGVTGAVTTNGVTVSGTVSGINLSTLFPINSPSAPTTGSVSASDGSSAPATVFPAQSGDQVFVAWTTVPSGNYQGDVASVLLLFRKNNPMLPSINVGGTLATNVQATLGSQPGTVDVSGLLGPTATVGATISGVGTTTGTASFFGTPGQFTAEGRWIPPQ